MRVIYTGNAPNFKSGKYRFVRSDSQEQREQVVTDAWYANLSPSSKNMFRIISETDMDTTKKVSVPDPEVPDYPPKGFATKADVIRYAKNVLGLTSGMTDYKKNFNKRLALKTLNANALERYIEQFGPPHFMKSAEDIAIERAKREAERGLALVKTGADVDESAKDDTIGTDEVVEL